MCRFADKIANMYIKSWCKHNKIITIKDPPDMEDSYEYIERTTAGSRQEVVFQLGGWTWG
jgi:hypothetical protein